LPGGRPYLSHYLQFSYKFHRLFPLSQYDLPSHNPRILSFPTPIEKDRTAEKALSSASPNFRSAFGALSSTTQEEIAKNNPDVDYTRYAEAGCLDLIDGSSRPDLISLVFSDVGSLTPSGKLFECPRSFFADTSVPLTRGQPVLSGNVSLTHKLHFPEECLVVPVPTLP
jgi:hypothetical protein